MIVHVLRNSLVPVVTFLGADLGALMGGAIVTEGIFNIKGVGGTLYSAIIRGDGPMVVSFTTVLVLVLDNAIAHVMPIDTAPCAKICQILPRTPAIKLDMPTARRVKNKP